MMHECVTPEKAFHLPKNPLNFLGGNKEKREGKRIKGKWKHQALTEALMKPARIWTSSPPGSGHAHPLHSTSVLRVPAEVTTATNRNQIQTLICETVDLNFFQAQICTDYLLDYLLHIWSTRGHVNIAATFESWKVVLILVFIFIILAGSFGPDRDGAARTSVNLC